MKRKITPTLEQKFLKELSKLEPIEFIGVARICQVPFVGEDDKEKDFATVLEEIMKTYSEFSATKKKNLLKVVKDANRA